MKRLVIFLLCFVILLTACNTAEPVKPVEIFELSATEGEADYRFVFPEGVSQNVTNALNVLCGRFRENESTDKIGIYNDTFSEEPDVTEILVGNTNRDTSAAVIEGLRDREFTIGVYDGNFVIAGADDGATVDALNHLYMHYDDFVIDSKVSSENNFTFKYNYKYDSIKIGKTDISAYTVVYPDPGGTYAEKESAEKYAAQRLTEQISQLCGAILPLENEKDSDAEYKIVIEKGEDKDSYSIRTKGKNIYISADSIYAYTKAYDALLDDDTIPKNFDAEGKDVMKETEQDDFVYVYYHEDKVYGDNPVGSIKIGDTDITEYRIIHHEYGKRYSGHGMNEIYAAQQLQRYLKYALGVELELDTDASKATEHEILIGNTDRTEEDTSEYGTEEYIIKTEGENLIITGGEERGTLYGVYSFLEDHIGCRFFAEDCEVIYRSEEIVIPSDINERYAPTLEYRDINERAYQIGEVAAKRKINSSFTRVMNYYQGSSVDFAGKAFVHTMSSVYGLGLDSAQPCFSDEENYQKVLEKSRSILKVNTNAEILSVTQNDNDFFCGCNDCTLVTMEEGSKSGPLIRFVNRLAEELYDEFPDVKIQTLAYMSTRHAPKITKPHENVIIEYCPIDSCCGHALCDLSCSNNADFRKQLEEWGAITDNLYVWYYVVEFTGNSRSAPFMNFDALYDNYTFFYRNGVDGVFNQATMNEESPEFGTLRAYLLTKLMWDPDMTKEEFDIAAREFIAAYYGEASDMVEEYFYMMNRFAKGLHFTQYAGLSGILDTNRLKVTLGELKDCMDELAKFDYTMTETQNHVNYLREGFEKYRGYLG